MQRKKQEIKGERLEGKREGKRMKMTKGGRKRHRKRRERLSAITAVSIWNCLDEISMIRGSLQPVFLNYSLQFYQASTANRALPMSLALSFNIQ